MSFCLHENRRKSIKPTAFFPQEKLCSARSNFEESAKGATCASIRKKKRNRRLSVVIIVYLCWPSQGGPLEGCCGVSFPLFSETFQRKVKCSKGTKQNWNIVYCLRSWLVGSVAGEHLLVVCWNVGYTTWNKCLLTWIHEGHYFPKCQIIYQVVRLFRWTEGSELLFGWKDMFCLYDLSGRKLFKC